MVQEMNEGELFDSLLQRMLNNPALDGLDKRESSVSYQMLAPVAMELAKLYQELFAVSEEAYIDTAGPESLKKKAREMGLVYREASFAKIKAKIESDETLAPGEKFLCGNRVFLVEEAYEGNLYLLTAEKAGQTAIEKSDSLLYFGYERKRLRASIQQIIQGEDAESAESLRARIYAFLDAAPFAGNKAAYRERVLAIEGVGGVRVDRPKEDGEEHNVLLTVIDSSYAPMGEEELAEIRRSLDPVSGDGEGFAPINHRVKLRSAALKTVRLQLTVQRKEDFEAESVQKNLQAAADAYAKKICRDWAEKQAGVLRKSALFASLLDAEGVQDILAFSMTDADGAEQSLLRFDGAEIPKIEVTVHE